MNFNSSSQKLKVAKANSAAAEKEKREKAARLQAATKKRDEDKAAVKRAAQLAAEKIDESYKAVESDYARAEVMAERHGKQVQFWDKEVKKAELNMFAPFDMEIGSGQEKDGGSLESVDSGQKKGGRSLETPPALGSPDSFNQSPLPSPTGSTAKRQGSGLQTTPKTPVGDTKGSKETTPKGSKETTPKGGSIGNGGRNGAKTSKDTVRAGEIPPDSVAATIARLKREK